MRRIQLTVNFESFIDKASNGAHDHFGIYSDGNELPEVIARAINKIRLKEYPNVSFKDFCKQIAETNVNTDEYFGVCTFSDKIN